MNILKAFVLNGVDNKVNILWENGTPLFRATEIADVLEMKNIRSSICNFTDLQKTTREFQTSRSIQEVTFLTEKGLYKLLMRSNKPKAESFQEWVIDILVSIRETGKYELQVKFDEIFETYRIALEKEGNRNKIELEKVQHNALIDAFKDKYVVYIGKIYENDGKYLIKIGSTKQIQNRARDLNKEYKSFNIFKVFECLTNEMFEKFLHHHPGILKYKYSEAIYDEHCSNGEVFLVNKNEIEEVVNIAIHNKFKFNHKIDNKGILEIERLKLQQMERMIELAKIQNGVPNTIDPLPEVPEIDITTYIDPIILLTENRKHTQIRGNKIQRYSEDGKQLLQTFASYAYAIRDENLQDATLSPIKMAIEKNTVYKKSRWVELDRQLPDDTIQILEETVKSIIVQIGYVAMFNLDKTEIVNVFCDQKAASENRKFKNGAAVCKAIKMGSKSGGHYFKMWNDCDIEIQAKYLEKNVLPAKRANGIQIDQLHPITGEFIQTFPSACSVTKNYKVARKTLDDACAFNIICKGYKWRLTPV
jgi:prophage antirepressor-like protein